MAITNLNEIEITSGQDTINFVPASYDIDYQSLASEDSGRTRDSSMKLQFLARKITKITISLPPHKRTGNKYARIFSYCQGQEVTVSFYDYLSHTTRTGVAMYCSETSAGYSYKDMVVDATFELIEMQGTNTVPHVTSG